MPVPHSAARSGLAARRRPDSRAFGRSVHSRSAQIAGRVLVRWARRRTRTRDLRTRQRDRLAGGEPADGRGWRRRVGDVECEQPSLPRTVTGLFVADQERILRHPSYSAVFRACNVPESSNATTRKLPINPASMADEVAARSLCETCLRGGSPPAVRRHADQRSRRYSPRTSKSDESLVGRKA